MSNVGRLYDFKIIPSLAMTAMSKYNIYWGAILYTYKVHSLGYIKYTNPYIICQYL